MKYDQFRSVLHLFFNFLMDLQKLMYRSQDQRKIRSHSPCGLRYGQLRCESQANLFILRMPFLAMYSSLKIFRNVQSCLHLIFTPPLVPLYTQSFYRLGVPFCLDYKSFLIMIDQIRALLWTYGQNESCLLAYLERFLRILLAHLRNESQHKGLDVFDGSIPYFMPT